jgi:hypothetical protein
MCFGGSSACGEVGEVTSLPKGFGWAGVGYVLSRILRNRSAHDAVQRSTLLTRLIGRAILVPVT